MNGRVFRRSLLAWAALLAGGCGAIPDIIADTARSSAQEALQKAVEDVVGGVIDDAVDELLDYADFESPLADESEGEADGDVLEEAG